MDRLKKPLFIGLAVLLLDALTKYLTDLYLPVRSWKAAWYPYGGIPIFENFLGIEFSITHATNKGAAWGVLANFQDALISFRIVMIAVLIAYVFFYNKNKAASLPFVLIISGALGNVIDFFVYGHVVDMFHFVLWGYDFPVFNVADMAIFFGIATLLTMSLLEGTKKSGSSAKIPS